MSASAGLDGFLDALPHEYYEENQMHAFILADMKDYERCIRETERFLPYVDNWATCDSIRPKIFGKHKKELLEHVRIWLSSAHTYTLRFAVDMLMTYYLGEDFREEYAESVIELTSGEYYVNMMRAWYFATAFAKNYEDILPCFERHRLDVWTHNKAIQKALESFRVSDEHKEYLRTLKIKG